jgi:hypothetical protein
MSKYETPGWKFFNVAVVCAVIGIFLWMASLAPAGLGLLLCIPLLGWFASRGIVHGGDRLLQWLSTAGLAKYQGSYYQFNGQQVRIYEHSGEVWFAAQDVMRAIGMKERLPDALLTRTHDCAPIPEAGRVCFNRRGLESFVVGHASLDGRAIITWAEREVIGPWEKKKAL